MSINALEQKSAFNTAVACYTPEDEPNISRFIKSIEAILSLNSKLSTLILEDPDKLGKPTTISKSVKRGVNYPILITDIDCRVSLRSSARVIPESHDISAGYVIFDEGKYRDVLNLWFLSHLVSNKLSYLFGRSNNNPYIYGSCMVLSKRAFRLIFQKQLAEDIVARRMIRAGQLSYGLEPNLAVFTNTNCDSIKAYYLKLFKWQKAMKAANEIKPGSGNRISNILYPIFLLSTLIYSLLFVPALFLFLIVCLSVVATITANVFYRRHYTKMTSRRVIISPITILQYMLDQILILFYTELILSSKEVN